MRQNGDNAAWCPQIGTYLNQSYKQLQNLVYSKDRFPITGRTGETPVLPVCKHLLNLSICGYEFAAKDHFIFTRKKKQGGRVVPNAPPSTLGATENFTLPFSDAAAFTSTLLLTPIPTPTFTHRLRGVPGITEHNPWYKQMDYWVADKITHEML